MFNYFKKINKNTDDLIEIIHNYIKSFYELHPDKFFDERELLEFIRDEHSNKLKNCDIKFLLLYLKLELLRYLR